MEKCKRVTDQDGYYLYVPESFDGYENFEGEEFFVFDEEELEPRNKAYVNALRVIKDRSLQQVDKAKADPHGYRLLRAAKKNHHSGNWGVAWQIKKETPYSIKIPVDVAAEEITADLFDFYNFVEVNNKNDFLNIVNMGHLDAPAYEDLYAYLVKRGIQDKPIVFDLIELASNLATGRYEITYWATDLI
jgi:hypothetical protein